MKRNKKKDDRPFRLRHPDFPIYVSAVSMAVSLIALLYRLLA